MVFGIAVARDNQPRMITEGSQQMRSWPHQLAVVLALLGSIGVARRAQSSGSETPINIPKSSTKPQKYDAPTDPSSYVGVETCKARHEDIYNNFETTPHFVTTMESRLHARTGPEWHGCGSLPRSGKRSRGRRRRQDKKSSPSKMLRLPIPARAAYDVTSMTTSTATSTGPLTWQAA